VRKSQETGSILAKLKSETERSKSILEKQALAEQKRKQLSYEAAVKAG